MYKKWILAIAGLSFALCFTSCDDQTKKEGDQKGQKEEKHQRRW